MRGHGSEVLSSLEADMTTIRDAMTRYIRAHSAVCHVLDPTDEQWAELDAAAEEYRLAEQEEDKLASTDKED